MAEQNTFSGFHIRCPVCDDEAEISIEVSVEILSWIAFCILHHDGLEAYPLLCQECLAADPPEALKDYILSEPRRAQLIN